MLTFETLECTVDGQIGWLKLNRPEKLNPLSTQCLEELIGAAAWFDGHDDIRVVVVHGAGRAFTAGADLASFGGPTGTLPRSAADAGRRMAEAIEQMQAVTIAAVHGHCIGGGVVLAAACDLRVAAESTNFAIPEVDLGIPLAWGGIQRLVREIGPAATRELVMTCRPFTALEAHVRGMVNTVSADDAYLTDAEELAHKLARKSRLTLRATLQAVDAAAEELVSTGTAWSDADSLVNALHDEESRAAAQAYLAARGR
ncbi:MAG: enoyl-CoA hydratase/isomerase family protein [Acidimicrobiales bacterium]|nr:enoyl-CoA hydratase/isomerase family protein [Acidimicrobiales bacterium]